MRGLEVRFWEKVNRGEPDECWPWTAATNEHGYGVLRPDGERHGPPLKAHRVSASLAGMDIDGLGVCHRCDNPPCVNPRHLYPGTQKDNSRDVFARGRQAAHQRPRLTDAEILAARRRVAAGETQSAVAASVGVSKQTMGRYMRRAVP